MIPKRPMTAASILHISLLSAVSLLLWVSASNVVCDAFIPAATTRTIPTAPITASSTLHRQDAQLNLFRLNNGKEKLNGVATVSNGEAVYDAFIIHGSAVKTKSIPYVIERLQMRPRDEVFKGIAEMCISVFFNNGKTGRAMPPWKELQLSYLRMIQMADLRRRRTRDQKTNAMFVAYRVEEASPNAARSQPLILNLKEIYNLQALTSSSTSTSTATDYVRTEVLGFCEVSMVPFGLAPSVPSGTSNNVGFPASEPGYLYETDEDDNLNSQLMVTKRIRNADAVARPVLTNLSVKVEARSSGVGSKLLEACERTAAREWSKSEMVLEVEDDNNEARKWYQKRGYRVLFSDPTSRRYDVNGLLLKKVSCTRQVMRKALTYRSTAPATSSAAGSNNNNRPFDSFGSLNKVLRRWRENVLHTTG